MNSKKRNMPRKKEIIKHWRDNYCETFDDTFCWGCGFPSFGTLDRAHLHAKSMGGSDDADNLVLLCRFCHFEVQETFANTKDQCEKIRGLIIDGMPFFNIRVAFYTQKIKSGLYDDIVDDLKINKDDWNKFRSSL